MYVVALADADRIEAEQIDATHYLARVYPSPWRSNIRLTCSDPAVLISPRIQGSGGRLVELDGELVEIGGGAAALRYPVIRLRAVEWLRDSLGSIAWEFGARDIHSSLPGYSLARVSYDTRALEFDVSGPAGSISLLRVENG